MDFCVPIRKARATRPVMPGGGHVNEMAGWDVLVSRNADVVPAVDGKGAVVDAAGMLVYEPQTLAW